MSGTLLCLGGSLRLCLPADRLQRLPRREVAAMESGKDVGEGYILMLGKGWSMGTVGCLRLSI